MGHGMEDFSGISQTLMRLLVRLDINLEADQLPMIQLLKLLKRVDASYEEFRARISTLERAVKNSSSEISDYLDKLREADTQNKQKTQDIINLLENIHLGILTIKSDGKVHQEYSKYLERILNTNAIADQDAMSLIFAQTDVNPDRISHMESVLHCVLGDKTIIFELNERALIRSCNMTDSNGMTKVLEIDWNPIIDSQDNVEKIVVTIRDVTEIQELRKAANQSKIRLDILGQIAHISNRTFQKFAQQTNSYLVSSREALQQNPADIHAVSRNLHTIKGSARILSFSYIADCIHDAEHQLKNAADHSSGKEFIELVESLLQKVDQVLLDYQSVADSQFHGTKNSGADVAEILQCVNDQFHLWLQGANPQLTCQNIFNTFQNLGAETLQNSLKEIAESLPKLARELGKSVPTLRIHDQGFRFKAEIAIKIADIIGHAIRNALDHGIESAAERLSKNKKPEGTITISLERVHDRLLLKIADDGKGLDLELIQKKAQQLGVPQAEQASPKEIASYIFHHNLSTATHVSQISGRGIGMDAMRGLAKDMGAEVDIELHEQQGRRAVPFELVFTFPESILLKFDANPSA